MNDTGGKFAAGVNDTGSKFLPPVPQVSLIPVANLPPVSWQICHCGKWDIQVLGGN